MKLDVRDAFANYQLNHSELVRLARSPEKLEEFCKSETHNSYAPAELDQALVTLGLEAERQRLEGSDSIWGSRDCAVYRRLGAMSETVTAPVVGCPSLATAGLALFDRLDENGDGRLGASELEEGLTSNRFHGREAAALVMLHCEQTLLKGAVRDGYGITRADLEHLRDQGIAGEDGRLAKGLAGREAIAESLPARLPLLEESFDPAGLRQAKSGTCASLATLLGRTPEQVRAMFADNGDGTVTVTLGDGSRQLVKDVSEAERLYQASAGAGERWPALLELAIGQRLKQLGSEHKFDDRSARSFIGLGQPYEHTFRMVAGSPCRRISLTERSPQRAREDLAEAMGEGTVVAGSRVGVKNGVVGNHAYQVSGYDAQRDVVTLRNPWGKGEWGQDGQDDGRFEMPFLQFYASFATVAVARRENLFTRASFVAGQAVSRLLGQFGIWMCG